MLLSRRPPVPALPEGATLLRRTPLPAALPEGDRPARLQVQAVHRTQHLAGGGAGSGFEDGESVGREAPKVGRVRGCERFADPQRGRRDHAVDERAAPSSGLVEQARGEHGILLREGNAQRHYASRELVFTLGPNGGI